MRIKKPVGVLTALALALMTAVIAVPSAAASAADEQFANRLYVLINDYRQQHALAPLRVDAQMAAASQSWTQQSADIANTRGAGTFVHSPGSYAFHENIVWNMSPDAAFQSWVQSAPHRANMLIAGATDIGIGAVQLTTGPNKGTFLATAQFGWSKAPVTAPAAPAPKPVAPKPAPVPVATPKPVAKPAQTPAPKPAVSSPAAAPVAAPAAEPAVPAAPVSEPAASPAPVPVQEPAPTTPAPTAPAPTADEQAAAEKAAAEKAAADEAKAAEEAAAETAAQDEAARQAAETAAAQAAAEKAAAEKAAAEQAAADKAAAQKSAGTPAAARGKSRALQAAEEPVLSPIEQVVLGNESLLTAAARGTVSAKAAGSQLSISGLAPGTDVETVVPAAGVNLGAMTADATGVIRVSVPPVLSAGEHKVALFQDGNLTGWASFTVEPAVTVLAAASVPAAAGTELAATGLNPAQMAIGGIGALMALIGAAALVAVQRQRSVSAG